MIAEGTYAAQLIKTGDTWLQFGRASTGNAQVLLSFEVEGGQRIQGFFGLTPASIGYTMDKLHTCGFSGDDLRAMLRQSPQGKVELVVAEDEYKGKRTMKIKFINRQGGFVIPPKDALSPAELDELSALAKPSTFDSPPPSDNIPF